MRRAPSERWRAMSMVTLVYLCFDWIVELLFDIALVVFAIGMNIFHLTWRPRRREDNLLEPLEVSRCPYCKSSKIEKFQNDPELWCCLTCYYEFDPFARVRERDRLFQSWRDLP